MNMRTMMAGLAVSTLIFGSASAALARPHYYGPMGGYHGGPCYYTGGEYQGMTQEKRDALDKLMQERYAQVEPLRQQLDAKRLELDALSRNPNATPESISKLAREVADLQSQLRQTGVEFQQKMEKETGLPMGPGMVNGNGMRGYGHRGFYGHTRGGHHMMGWDD